jgi:hypothetical protein
MMIMTRENDMPVIKQQTSVQFLCFSVLADGYIQWVFS